MLLLAKGRDQLRKQLKAWTPFSSHEKALRLSSSSLLRLSFFISSLGKRLYFHIHQPLQLQATKTPQSVSS